MRLVREWSLVRACLPAALVLLCASASTGGAGPLEEPLLPFSTYLGGSGSDSAAGIAVGPDGVIWLAMNGGPQDRTNAAGPILPSPPRTSVFLVRLDPSTRSVLSTTRLPGSGIDTVGALAIDSAGNAYIAGRTSSPEFRLAAGVAGADGSAGHPFVARAMPDGSGFTWVFRFGSRGSAEAISDLCIAPGGDPVVAGFTSSQDFPVVGAAAATFGGETDAFVARIRADGSGFVFSTLLGGEGHDGATSVCASPDGLIVVGGQSGSPDFLAPADRILGAITRSPKSAYFLAAIEPADGTRIRFAHADGATIDHLAGTEHGFVLTGVAFDEFRLQLGPPPTFRDASRNFVAELSDADWTVRGGSWLATTDERVTDVAVGADGTIWTTSQAEERSELPVPGAVRPVQSVGYDAYVAAFAPETFVRVFGTFLGGRSSDRPAAVAIAADGSAWVAGSTWSDDFPAVHAVQGAPPPNGIYESEGAFVAQLRHGVAGARPASVKSVGAATSDDGAVRVSWTPGDAAATSFAIDRAQVDDWGNVLDRTRVAVVSAEARECADATGRSDRRYRYSVQAVNEAGGSPPSLEAEVRTRPTLAVQFDSGGVDFGGPSQFSRDRLRLRGTIRSDGTPLDPQTGGFRMLGGDIDNGEIIVSIPADDPRWRTRRGGRLSWRYRSWVKLEFDPATGEFDVKVGTRGFRLRSITLQDTAPFVPLRIAIGSDSGSAAPSWRPIPGRGPLGRRGAEIE